MPSNHGTRHDYHRTYAHSLSLLLGRGFADLSVVGTPAATPIDEFLWLERDRLSWDELADYAADMPKPSDDPHYGIYRALATTRVLDVYLTALLWRIFGISWTALYVAAAVASTICCYLIYLIGRRLGGGFWHGFLAAVAFFASPTEKFLNGWSIRDSSPLWFAAAAFCLLVCFFDRASSLRRYGFGALLLGAVAWLGTGWRMDALIVAPFAAAVMAVAVLAQSRSVLTTAACVAFFCGGSFAAYATIKAIGPQDQQAKGTGFHMAYYGDAVRSNLLGIENSCQVTWCDMQTVMEARRYAAAAERSNEPLPYISDRYGEVCRRMYFGLLRYNAYRWTAGFPYVWWQALRSFPDDDANGVGWSQYRDTLLDEGRPRGWPPLDARAIERLAPHAVPVLVVFGGLWAVALGRQRLLSAGLAVFTVYFAAIMLAVLPMQKHAAMVLLPSCVFAGIGLCSLAQLFRPAGWRRLRDQISPRGCAVFAAVAASIAAAWGGACVVAYQVSYAERISYVTSLLDRSATGVDAAETLFGSRIFRTAIEPGSENDNTGYLLTIRTDAKPAPLICRHRRMAFQGLRPCILQTTHVLAPNREQHFFVSCLQGSEFGDPRAYTCTVRCHGDASITSSRRVDLADWDKLAVSTVFVPEDATPGSPSAAETATRWALDGLPIYARPNGDAHAISDRHEGILFQSPRPVETPSAPLTHLAVRDRASGAWRFLLSDGRQFATTGPVASWTPSLEWHDVASGDFDGDGVTDIAGRETVGGGWWVTAPHEVAATTAAFGSWSVGEWIHVRCGDFNGDGLDDFVGYAPAAAQWWAALSDGFRFVNAPWGAWPADRSIDHVQVADLNGDGRDDLVAFEPEQGDWVAFISRNDTFEPASWGRPHGAVANLACVADLNGDGNADLAAVSTESGTGHVGLSNGSRFEFQGFAADRASSADLVRSGDFDGDGRDEIVFCTTRSGRLERGRWTVSGLVVETCGEAGQPIRFLAIGDFAGEGRDAIAAFLADGSVQVGVLKHGQLHFTRWLDQLQVPFDTEPHPLHSFSAP